MLVRAEACITTAPLVKNSKKKGHDGFIVVPVFVYLCDTMSKSEREEQAAAEQARIIAFNEAHFAKCPQLAALAPAFMALGYDSAEPHPSCERALSITGHKSHVYLELDWNEPEQSYVGYWSMEMYDWKEPADGHDDGEIPKVDYEEFYEGDGELSAERLAEYILETRNEIYEDPTGYFD